MCFCSVLRTESRDTKISELKMATYIACHGSLRGIDHLGELVKELFPCDATADLRLHRTKCGALIKNVIAPNIIKNIVDDMGLNQYYSLIIDESTDVACSKNLCLCVRYFSKKENEILSALLGLVQVVSTTADDLYNAIAQFLQNIGLALNKIVGLGTDGASNLCGSNNSVYTKLRAHNPNLILMRCVCHSLHLCAQAAFKELPANIDFMLRESYSWFSHSPLRRSQYNQLWETIDGETHALKLVSPAATRWLSLHQCLVRIVDQWDVLSLHFGLADKNERCYTARLLHGMYSDATNRLYCVFLLPILAEFAEMNAAFQHRQADLYKLSNDLKSFAMTLISRIISPPNVSFDVDLDNANVFLPLVKVDFGYEFETQLQSCVAAGKITAEQREAILHRCFQFLKMARRQVIKRLPTSFDIYSKIELFSPTRCLSVTDKPSFACLPLLPSSYSVTEAEKEWRKLSFSAVCMGNPNGFEKNTYDFWCGVSRLTTCTNVEAFPNISALALMLQLLPISNAVVEQSFSQVTIVKTKVRNRLNVDMLSSLLIIRSYLMWRNNCCLHFEPSQGMLDDFNVNMYDNSAENDDLAAILSEMQ
jgi:hypothetical protein